jgi:hemoglobin
VTLYDEIGGQVVLKSAVTVFYNRVTEDAALAQWFGGVDLSTLRAHQRAFLAAALGGPDLFAGRDLSVAHAGMNITDEAFDAIVAHLLTTLDDLSVERSLIDRVGEQIEQMRVQVVV